MQLIQSFILGKRPDQALCEDGIVQTPHLIAIVDGATAKDPQKFEGKSSGRFAMETLCAALAAVGPDVAPLDLEPILSSALDAASARAVGRRAHALPLAVRPAASAVVFLRASSTLVFLGDCQALVAGSHWVFENPTDGEVARTRRLFAESLKAQGLGAMSAAMTSREMVEPLLRTSQVFRNNEGLVFSFPALDGTSIPASLICTVTVPAGATVVLASDGYPELLPTLELSEARLAHLLEQDPEGLGALLGVSFLAPGNHSFDDRAYLRFKA